MHVYILDTQKVLRLQITPIIGLYKAILSELFA